MLIAGRSKPPAPACYFAWGCFRYFVWRAPARPFAGPDHDRSRRNRRVGWRSVTHQRLAPRKGGGPARAHCIYAETLMPVGPRMTTNSTGRKNRIIGTVSFGGSAAAFFSASFM